MSHTANKKLQNTYWCLERLLTGSGGWIKKHKFGEETKTAVDLIPTLEDAFISVNEISPHKNLEICNQSLIPPANSQILTQRHITDYGSLAIS